ncbi:hypothetical protein [uncultured Thermanaerothrix sp.]|uniref:hypothetical protein n=1 Tax=uncultured Thermanaerothrix sp. TaxID=1195149 RepID=UPI00261961ED|nr:hypothetical protein [uncultured Thermanaerothrix sp.]
MINPPLALLILAALGVLGVPGAVWVAWRASSDQDGLEQLAEAVGLSVALTALGGLLLFTLGVPLTTGDLRVAYAVLALLALGGLAWRCGRVGGHISRQAVIWGVGGAGALFGVVMWRFYQARGMVFPAWVDSVHHVFIVRKIMEVGGIPATLQPEISTFFSYHYGFHLVTAWFARLSHLEAAQAVLWLGQVLNALVALSVYRLGKGVWGDPWRAGLAALLVGFAFQMPAYYLVWGRYTLLTGLIMLPLAMAAALDLWRRPQSVEAFVRLGVLTAGVALSHYTALLLLILFGGVLLFLKGWGFWRLSDHAARAQQVLPLGAVVLGLGLGGGLALPWLWRVVWHLGAQASVRVVSPLDASQMGYFRYILDLLGPRHNHILMVLAGLASIYGLTRAHSRLLAGWGLVLVLLMLPWGVRLGPFRPDHMAIVLFLPAALCLADGGVSVWNWLVRQLPSPIWQRVGQGVGVLLALGVLGWGAWSTRTIINPVTQLANAADKMALDWVRANLSEEARFFINVTPWQGDTYRGVDGGYWLLPYAGRASLLPPVLYAWGDAVEAARINHWAAQAAQLKDCDAAFWALVEEAELTYAYVREGRGSLQPAALNQCAGVVPIYRRAGVYIYALER